MKSWAACCAVLCACNVTAGPTSGGADLPARGPCPTGLAVLSTDFQSSELALLFPNGEVASSAFFSSASSQASGLAAPLSGDVVLAASRARAGELVTVDRMGTNVLTFIDTKSASVRAQLPVGTGFDANAQSYIEVNAQLALVPRPNENSAPGREEFDAGGDLLLVDPSVPSIVGSLAMPRKDGFLPDPTAATVVGTDALVTLRHVRPGYRGMAEAELVGVALSDVSVRYRLPLRGLKNCGKAELSPSRASLAIACEGYIDFRGAAIEPEASGLVLFDLARDPPRERARFLAQDSFGGPIQDSVEFVSEGLVLLKTQTALGGTEDNQLYALNLKTRETTLLATAAPGPSGSGFGIAFGGMSCNAGCGDPCVVADRSRGMLLRFDSALEPLEDVLIRGAGLPPSGITPFW